MASTFAILQSDQPGGAGVGTPGEGRLDITIVGGVVNFADTEALNAGASYVHTLEEVPEGSATTLANGETATPSFTPDATGSYTLKTVVDGAYSNKMIVAVVLANIQTRIPAYSERGGEFNPGGQEKGYHPDLTEFMRKVDAKFGKADALTTSGADVVISSALPPVAGQVLKAASATVASWADEVDVVGATGENIIDTFKTGDSNEHDSATPLIVSQFQFDPTEYGLTGSTRSLVFRAIAANAGGATSTKVELFNLTDSELVATLNFTSALPTVVSAVLAEGAGVGLVKLSPRVYEVRIYVDAPDAIDDKILFGSAELRIINTVN